MKLIPFAISALILVGCGNTAAGIKEDSSDNSQRVADSTKNVVTGAKEAGKAFGAATTLTPKVKLALVADKLLNTPQNLIDVASTDDVVTLSGHVTSEDLKSLATEVASKALTEAKATQKLENNLVVEMR
jgi:predicted small secreted protein